MVVRNVHQSGSDNHDRLGIHPDCPLCGQDRLFGVLSPEPIWSRRLRVLLAAGVLAVSAGASEPDDQQEGIVAPTPGASPPVGDGPGPGSGGETALPIEVDPVPAAPDGGSTDGQPDDAAPLEAPPVDDPDGGLALSDPNAPVEGDVSTGDPRDVDASETPVPPAEPIPPVTPVPAAPGAPACGTARRPTGGRPRSPRRRRTGRGRRPSCCPCPA